jgi:PKD repeat protein
MISKQKNYISILVYFVLILLLLTPIIAHGQTIDEIKVQIAALFSRIQSLQAELDLVAVGSSGGTVSVPNQSTGATGTCPIITRSLNIGSEGSDVTALQKYLASNTSIYPEGLVTGYFGALSQSAVQRWQASRGIVSSGTPSTTGYGVVGPKTREALRNCSGGVSVDPGEVGALLRVTPIKGNAPLTVSATATINTARSCSFAIYKIDFGDGTLPTDLIVPSSSCQELTHNITHTYVNPGTFTVTLSIGSHKTTVRVTVDPGQYSGPSTTPTSPGILSVSPSSGAVPLAVTGSFLFRSGNPYEIDWGDGTLPLKVGSFHERQNLPVATTVFSQPLETRTLTHTYRIGGTHTVILRAGQYERVGDQWVWKNQFYTTQVLTSGTIGPDTGVGGEGMKATPTSGQAPITATFTVRVNGSGSCNGGSYTLDFGDGENTELPYPADGCAPRDYEVTHRYDKAGTYKSKLFPTLSSQIATSNSIRDITISVSEPPAPPIQPTGNISSASPKSGPVPLNVSFVLQVNTHKSCEGGTYTLDFGDDTNSELTYAADLCTSKEFIISHTYDTIGTYTVKLYPVSAGNISTSSAVDSGVISVLAINHGAFTVTPNIDDNPKKFKVSFGINGSSCTSYLLSWGDGTADVTHNAGTATTCTSNSITKEFTHTYTNSGTYTIRLRRDRGSLSDLTIADEQAASVVISSN